MSTARRGWAWPALVVAACLWNPLAATAEPLARAAVVAGVCGDAAALGTTVTGLLPALPALADEERGFVRAIARSLLDRTLACEAASAVMKTDGASVDAVTGEPRTASGDARSPVLNLRGRGAVELLDAGATLLVGRSTAERAGALKTLERKAESVPPSLFSAALAAETDASLRTAIEAVLQSTELRSPDPAKRASAVARIADAPTVRSLTQLRALTGDPAYGTDPAFRTAVDRATATVQRWLALTGALDTLYNGLSFASILFMAAVGLAIIFGLMGIINLAQGEFIMLGAYVTYMVQQAFRAVAPAWLDWYLVAAIPIVALVVGAIGMLVEAVLIRHFYRRPLMSLLATWAVSLLLINLVRVGFGTQNLQFETPFYVRGGVQVVGDFIVTWNRLFAIVFAAVTLAGTAFILRRTPLGLDIRAVTLNRDMAGCIGIRTRRVDQLAFGFGSALAGLAGLALSPIYNVNPQMGTLFVIDSFMVVVLGGVGTLTGTVVAALGVGQINVVIEPLYGAVAAKVLVLLMIVVFLQWRPEGLFAVKGRRK